MTTSKPASHIAKILCTVGLACACAFGLVACSGGSVAATVNGTEIKESTISDYIQNFREAASLSEEDAWGEWMVENGYTPEKVREEIIDFFVGQELVKQAAQEEGIAVEASEVDSIVEEMKANYGTDEDWQEALKGAGTTEAEYRETIELSLTEEALKEKVAVSEDASEEQIVEYLKEYGTTFDGAKRSSHILFNSEDADKANEVLAKVKSGELDFAEAAKEYSQDTGSAENGGDVGWDALNQFVSEYSSAVAALEKDQISDLVTSDYGFHIIKVTDVFTAPKEITKSSQVPSEFIESIKESLTSMNGQEAYQEWYDKYKEGAEVVINDMPNNVPYNVDMSKYESTDEQADKENSTEEGAENGSEISQEDLEKMLEEAEKEAENQNTEENKENSDQNNNQENK